MKLVLVAQARGTSRLGLRDALAADKEECVMGVGGFTKLRPHSAKQRWNLKTGRFCTTVLCRGLLRFHFSFGSLIRKETDS